MVPVLPFPFHCSTTPCSFIRANLLRAACEVQAYLRAYAAPVNHSFPVGSELALMMASIAAQGLSLVVFMGLEALKARGSIELSVDSAYLP